MPNLVCPWTLLCLICLSLIHAVLFSKTVQFSLPFLRALYTTKIFTRFYSCLSTQRHQMFTLLQSISANNVFQHSKPQLFSASFLPRIRKLVHPWNRLLCAQNLLSICDRVSLGLFRVSDRTWQILLPRNFNILSFRVVCSFVISASEISPLIRACCTA